MWKQFKCWSKAKKFGKRFNKDEKFFSRNTKLNENDETRSVFLFSLIINESLPRSYDVKLCLLLTETACIQKTVIFIWYRVCPKMPKYNIRNKQKLQKNAWIG